MSFSNFLYTLVFSPVEHIIEAVFYYIRYFFPTAGVAAAIVGVSLVVNFLSLPIYNIAEFQQLKERDMKKRLSYRSSRIRKAFKGEERFLILSAYYRLNHYNPVYALREVASVLVQVPFFIAAYHFLSNCTELAASLGPIKSLAKPDSLLVIGSFRLNLLPVLMTVMNVISGIIYTRDAPLREKIQSPFLALVFLFLLYGSPSGLVLYWTLNSLFSLAKNAVKSFCPRPWIVVELCVSFVALAVVAVGVYLNITLHLHMRFFYIFLLVPAVIPVARIAGAKLSRMKALSLDGFASWPLLFFSCLAAALLMGLALPSSLISTSPEEFAFLGSTDSPLSYIASSLTFAAGLCIVWPMCIFGMADRRHRPAIAITMLIIAVTMILNVFVFRHDYGYVSVTGEVESLNGLRESGPLRVFGPVLAVAVILLLFALFLFVRKARWIPGIMASVCVALLLYAMPKLLHIHTTFSKYRQTHVSIHEEKDDGGLEPIIHLSKTGKNVIKIFLDKSMGVFVPYIMRQFPELLESYRGFTLYPNTVSFSNFTIEGSPALFGGYEYSPAEINKRKEELLNKKTNEAQLLLPRIFSEAGYAVTITDPVYTSYENGLDEDFMQDCPDAKVVRTSGKYSKLYVRGQQLADTGLDELVRDGIIRFFVLQCLYPPLRYYYYIGGQSSNSAGFIDAYSTLYYLPSLTDTEATRDTYMLLYNKTAHDVTVLEEPDYHPGMSKRGDPAGSGADTVYPYQSGNDLVFYECNAAALLQVGKWLDALKSMGVYDNTRIVIVGDHGAKALPHFSEGFSVNDDYGWFHTLLMVKDFGADGDFMLDDSFMTNADSVWMSLEGLGLDMTNPYTGKRLSDGKKEKAGGVNVFLSLNANSSGYINSTQYPIDINRGYHVSDDIYKESNWVPFARWIQNHPEDIPEGAAR